MDIILPKNELYAYLYNESAHELYERQPKYGLLLDDT